MVVSGLEQQACPDMLLCMYRVFGQVVVDRSSLLTLSHRSVMHQAGRVNWHGLQVEVQGVLTPLSAAAISTCIEPAGLSLA
jgi:hypothetical protein